MALLEDFEGGAVDDVYVETNGDGWTVQAVNRSTGFAAPVLRPLPDPVQDIPPAAIATTQGLAFVGTSAFGLSVDYEVSLGLGGYFYSDAGGAGGSTSLSLQVSIGFTTPNIIGSITVERRGTTLHLTEFYDDLTTYIDNETTVELTDFLPSETLPVPSGVWLEVSFVRGSGWVVRDATTSALLASGAYPWSIPPGAPWALNAVPNSSGPSGLAGSNRVYMDNIYGFAGNTVAPAIRLFPRSDGRGMSSAPRIHPAPSSQRVIGGHQ